MIADTKSVRRNRAEYFANRPGEGLATYGSARADLSGASQGVPDSR